MAVPLFYLSIKLRITETIKTADKANGCALSICFFARLLVCVNVDHEATRHNIAFIFSVASWYAYFVAKHKLI
jgi:hypothetical protein